MKPKLHSCCKQQNGGLAVSSQTVWLKIFCFASRCNYEDIELEKLAAVIQGNPPKNGCREVSRSREIQFGKVKSKVLETLLNKGDDQFDASSNRFFEQWLAAALY